MFQNSLKKLFLFLLFMYLICFCLFFYSHPTRNLTHWDWAKGINIDYNIYFQAAKNFIKKNSPYYAARYFYPPFFAILLSPLLIFPLFLQKSIWVIFNLVLVVSLWFLLLHYFTKGIKKYQAGAIALLVIASSIPLINNFKWGQVSVLISLLIITSYIAFKKNHYLLSALTLAMASSIKIIPVVFLLFYIVNWKKGVLRLLVWFIAFSSIFLLWIPLISQGSEKTYQNYYIYYKKMTVLNKLLSQGKVPNQTITGILFRYFSKDYPLKKGKRPLHKLKPGFLPFFPLLTAGSIQTIAKILSMMLLFYTLYLSKRKKYHSQAIRDDQQQDIRFCLFISGTLACTNHAWIHYYVLLIVPYYLLLISLIKKDFKDYGFSSILFFLSFATLHGNIFLIQSSYLLALFESLGLFYWSNIFLFLYLIQYLHRDHKSKLLMTEIPLNTENPCLSV